MFKPDQIFFFVDFETTGIDTSTKSPDYPIEIACVIANHNLEMLQTYQAPIWWPHFDTMKDWTPLQQEAADVHGITFEKLKETGAHPDDVRKDLNKLAKKYSTGRKPTLISDAPNFEAFHMQRLYSYYEESHFPFHYNWWSIYPAITMFYEKPKLKMHRALDDVIVMYDAFVFAYIKAKVNNLMLT